MTGLRRNEATYPEHPRTARARGGNRWAPALIFAGVFITQMVWTWATPPFRAIDEIDHAFRAASVARGDVRPDHGLPQDGRGALVEVPAKLATAARAQCEALEYTGRDNCFPVRALSDGRVLIASAAAPYSPAYYWIIGKLAQPFDGTTALYAMRVASCLINALLIGAAAWCLQRQSASGWPLTGLLIGLTPMAIYTTMIPAPNGLELAGAVLLWCALLALQRASTHSEATGLLWLISVAGVLLASIRLTGPVFIPIIVGFAALVAPKRTLEIVRARAVAVGVAVALTTLATGLHYWWMTTHLPVESTPVRVENEVRATMQQPFLWFFQWIGAFPFRDNPASPLTYAACGTAIAVILVLGARQPGRSRWIAGGIVLICVVGPLAYTWATISTRGTFWQGRYALPILIGAPLVLALALDRKRHAQGRPDRILQRALLSLQAIGGAVAIIHLVEAESSRAVSAQDPYWHQPPPVMVVMFIAAACATFMAAVNRPTAALRRT